MKKIETDVLILGAGWSGLIAADFISQKRGKVVILEKLSEVGGLARTLNFNGFKFDIGGHGLFFKNQGNINYLKNIVEHDDLVTLKRRTRVLFNNKYLDYPPNFSSALRIDKKYILNIFFDMFRLKKNTRLNNFEEWVKVNYGDCLYEIYFKDYTEKVWGEPCNKLSSSWADKRIGTNNLFKSFKGIFGINGYCKENRRFFYYPKGGISLLPDSLEKKLKNNCSIYKNVQLKQFSMIEGRPASLSFISDGCLYEISFKQVVSSLPIVELIKLFPQDITSDIIGLLPEIRYRNLILVNLIINKEILTNWYWCYFPSKKIIFSRIHEPKFWSKEMAPGDKTLICVEIFCNYDDLYWGMGNKELIQQVKNDLQSTGLLNTERDIIDAMVNKIEYAYPLQYNGFKKPLIRVKDFLSDFNNLHIIGRNGTHSYFDMEECLEDSKKVLDF